MICNAAPKCLHMHMFSDEPINTLHKLQIAMHFKDGLNQVNGRVVNQGTFLNGCSGVMRDHCETVQQINF